MTAPRSIPIRTVQTFTATGLRTDRHFVCCPVHEHSTTVEGCAACLHHVSRSTSHDSVVCGAAAEDCSASATFAADRLRVRALADQTLVTAAMTRDVACVAVGESLDGVGGLFVAREISGAPVVDETGRPIGIVSKSDLVRDQQRAGGGRTAGHVMTAFVATVPDTASLSDVAELMSATGIHRVVVVSAKGTVAGIISTFDLLKWLAEPSESGTIPPPFALVRARIPAARASVSSLMGARVVCVEPKVSSEQLATILLDEQISGVPVVERSGLSIGVVSKTDLVESHQNALHAALVLEPDGDLSGSDATPDASVNELMTRTAISVREHTSVLRAATLMVEHGVHRLPVLTDDGRVIGLLTALDVARWLAAGDIAAARTPSEPPDFAIRSSRT